ncbi:MAG TPA: glycosyltransferase family 2 protein [Burkholderiales bacterium]
MSQVQDRIVSDTSRAAADVRRTPDAPLVSVVIPTCNRAALARRAIESVVRQSYANLEIIVVDDASSDGTGGMVRSLADPRIRYLRHEERRGGSAARNTGIRAATGAFIAFLDDDDEWEPDKTEEHLRALAGYDAVLCSSSAAEEAERAGAAPTPVRPEDLRQSPYAKGGAGVLMARTDVMRDVMFDESLPKCQDWDVFIRIACRYRLGFLNRALVKYNDGDHDRITNVLIALPFADLERRLVMLDKHKDFFGARLHRRHACRMLLYGVFRRKDTLAHIARTARRHGLGTAMGVLLRHVWHKCRTAVRHALRARGGSGPRTRALTR